MRSAFVFAALAALAAANPGAVSGSIAPSGGSPPGCAKTYNGAFGISPTNISSDASKRSLKPRDTDLTISLTNGVLKDSLGRTGYVAANEQFQFDKPPQAGAIYTAGFTICSNGSLALGDDAIWYSCLSGDFYNLYFESQGGQCFPVTLQVVGGSSTVSPPVTGAAPTPTTTAACTEYVDGQPQCTTAAPAPVCSEYVDGQPQCEPCSEYVDGQPQCATAAPAPACSEYVDGQPQCATTAAPVCSEYVDGQPQCTTAAPPAPACSEYVDGQPQCTTAAPPAPVCSEYVDGQPQCTTAAPPAPACSEYVDGQPQCTTAAPPAPVCSEYVDGQPQCTTAAPSPACSEYVDGQPQCSVPSGTGSAWTGAPPYTGAPIATGAAVAPGVGKEMFGLAAGVLAFAML